MTFEKSRRERYAVRDDVVRVVGFEPTRLTAQEPKSCMSTISIIPAYEQPENVFWLLFYKIIFRKSRKAEKTFPKVTSPKFTESTNSTMPTYELLGDVSRLLFYKKKGESARRKSTHRMIKMTLSLGHTPFSQAVGTSPHYNACCGGGTAEHPVLCKSPVRIDNAIFSQFLPECADLLGAGARHGIRNL
jgi:hypothetical protein